LAQQLKREETRETREREQREKSNILGFSEGITTDREIKGSSEGDEKRERREKREERREKNRREKRRYPTVLKNRATCTT